MLLVTGGCPNLSFFIGLQRVVTDSSTDFRKGSCDKLDIGATVDVDGTTTDGVVHAAAVTLHKDNSDAP